MKEKHGHIDEHGLEAELRDNVSISDLLSNPCVRCGKPRNQRGDNI